jgi:hypothetical protein
MFKSSKKRIPLITVIWKAAVELYLCAFSVVLLYDIYTTIQLCIVAVMFSNPTESIVYLAFLYYANTVVLVLSAMLLYYIGLCICYIKKTISTDAGITYESRQVV